MGTPKAAAAAIETVAPARPPRAPAAQLGEGEVKQILADSRPISALLHNEIWAREAGIKFNSWEAVPPAGTPFENVLKPEFWANVARRMKMGDKIIVMPRDGAWYGELLVWDAGQNWAHVSGPAVERPAFDNAPGVDDEFEIVSDPIDGVCVKRRGTGQVLKKNCANAEDARVWIISQQKAMRR